MPKRKCGGMQILVNARKAAVLQFRVIVHVLFWMSGNFLEGMLKRWLPKYSHKSNSKQKSVLKLRAQTSYLCSGTLWIKCLLSKAQLLRVLGEWKFRLPHRHLLTVSGGSPGKQQSACMREIPRMLYTAVCVNYYNSVSLYLLSHCSVL